MATPKPKQDQFPFATKLFTPHFLFICDNPAPRLHKNHNFTYSPILLPMQKKPIHRKWLRQNPSKINFLLQPKISPLIFNAFVTIPQEDCTKTITSLIHQFCYQGKKRESTELG